MIYIHDIIYIYIYIYIYIVKYIILYIYYWAIGQISRVFANDPGDRSSIPGLFMPKTQKMVVHAILLDKLD